MKKRLVTLQDVNQVIFEDPSLNLIVHDFKKTYGVKAGREIVVKLGTGELVCRVDTSTGKHTAKQAVEWLEAWQHGDCRYFGIEGKDGPVKDAEVDPATLSKITGISLELFSLKREKVLEDLAYIDKQIARVKARGLSAVAAPPSSVKIARPSATARLPAFTSLIGTPLFKHLTQLGQQMYGSDHSTFRADGFDIPMATLPAAVAFCNASHCQLCSAELAPRARHAGEMPFLISKEGLQSLVENEQDHGLDYHLRAAFDIGHQVGHLVGEKLVELGIAELVMLQNARTGRIVRGIRLSDYATPDWVETEIMSTLGAAVIEPLSNRTDFQRTP